MWQYSPILERLSSVVQQHNARLVFMAGLICALACYTALTLVARAGKPGKTSSDPWLVAAAVVIGCGIWAVHFVTLLAYQPGLRVGYDAGQALLAAAAGIVCSGLGFAFVVRGRVVVLGGAAIGGAATLMNYLVMSALRLPAHEHWNVDFVALSFLIGTGLGAAALWCWRKQPDWRGQFAAALLLTGGVLGTHFAGMAGLTLTPDPSLPVPTEMIPPIWFSVAVTAICLLIVGLGVIGSLVDQHIRELEATKAELEQTAEHLRLALKAASAADNSKSQFLASMSHELRTPLNAILGFSEILKDVHIVEPARVRNYAVNIFESGSHLLELIDDVLDLSKLDAGHLELGSDAIDVREAIASCLRLMVPHSAKADVRLHCDVPDGAPILRADDRRVRQILLNLISNAVKFTPAGGSVEVAVSWSDSGFAISVADTGIGMTPDEIPVALERFGQIDSRLSRKYTGTGLGLPLSKHLMELHGGTLTIVSATGKGTVVTAMFPPERMERIRIAA
ncbi:MAG TPA: ATP-binding protein [Rhizomicrobium sp.]|nr:ATP-binding protein [Rhizomicrobium sp.]